MARRSFACACGSGVEVRPRAAPPWAGTGVVARSDGGGAEGERGRGTSLVG